MYSFLFIFCIIVSCLKIPPPLQPPHPPTQHCPQTGTRFLGGPGGAGCFPGSWRKDWIKKGEISWFWGFFKGGKKIRGGCILLLFFFIFRLKVDWQGVSFRVSFLQSVWLGWTNTVKKIFSEVELFYWPSAINMKGFHLQISEQSINILLFGFSV